MRCGVCGLEGANPLKLQDGSVVGHAHDGKCQVLLWEADFARKAGYSKHEQDVIRWEWRQHKASVLRLPFVEEAPRSPAEIEITKNLTLDKAS